MDILVFVNACNLVANYFLKIPTRVEKVKEMKSPIFIPTRRDLKEIDCGL